MKIVRPLQSLLVLLTTSLLLVPAWSSDRHWSDSHSNSRGTVISPHPCPGPSSTDALHGDSTTLFWVGCGSNAKGYGLYATADGGQSWITVTTNPSALMNDFRVFSIIRGHDSAIYAAGTGLSNRRVLRLDTSTAPPFAAEVTLMAAPTTGYQFIVGSYAELSDGRAIAESENGFDWLYRPSAATPPLATDWIDPPTSLDQFRDLIAYNDQFYAVGSRINEPPKVFLPPLSPAAEPWDMVEIELDNLYDGEMLGVAANSQRVVAVGVDDDGNVGKIYVSQNDAYDAGDYLVHDLPNIVGTGGIGTWARGVCMHGDRIVVVGERQPLGTNSGLAMASSDGGQTFFDITPLEPGRTLSRCVIDPGGLVTVAGAAGWFGHWYGFLPSDEIFNDRFSN